MVFPCTDDNIQAVTVSEAWTVLLRKEVIIFSRSSRGFTHRKKLEEVEFVDKEFLHKLVNKNSAYMKIMLCYRRYSRKDTIHHAVKAAWVKHYGELTVLNWRRWLRYCSFLVVKPVDYFWLLYFVFSLVLAKLKTWCLIFVFSLVFQLLQLGRVW